MSIERLMALRYGGAVKRFHTERMIQEQNIAAHSWGVAMILLHVFPEAPVHLIRAALVHDLSEMWTGDVPAPAKWGNKTLKSALDEMDINFRSTYHLNEHLYDHEKLLLKWCDYIETGLHAWEDVRMGNHYAAPIVRKIMGALAKLECPDVVRDLYEQLKAQGLEHIT